MGGGTAHNLLFVAGERGVGGFAPRFPALDAHSGGVVAVARSATNLINCYLGHGYWSELKSAVDQKIDDEEVSNDTLHTKSPGISPGITWFLSFRVNGKSTKL